MYVKRRRGWEIPESQATPEHVYLSRREMMGAGAMLLAGLGYYRDHGAPKGDLVGRRSAWVEAGA